MRLWATQCSWRCPCLWQGDWARWPLKASSNPKHSMILWFYCQAKRYFLKQNTPELTVNTDLNVRILQVKIKQVSNPTVQLPPPQDTGHTTSTRALPANPTCPPASSSCLDVRRCWRWQWGHKLIRASQTASAESFCAVGHPQTTPSLWPGSLEPPHSCLQTHQECPTHYKNLHGSECGVKAGDRLKIWRVKRKRKSSACFMTLTWQCLRHP